MMDTDILDMLEDIGRSSVARLSPAVVIAGDTAAARRAEVLRMIRGTILPRRLEFTAANGDCLAFEVNSSRVTDVFRVASGPIPDFDTAARDGLIEDMARLVTDISSAPAPLELLSRQPDSALEADDVGVTLREIENACAKIDLPADPIVSVVTDDEVPVAQAPEPSSTGGLAQSFFAGADRFALGCVLASAKDGDISHMAEDCAPGGPLSPDQALLSQFAADLAGWDKDTQPALDHPQLIVMRPSGGKGTGLAVVNDGQQIAFAAHEARKLGAVVNLWTALREAAE